MRRSIVNWSKRSNLVISYQWKTLSCSAYTHVRLIAFPLSPFDFLTNSYGKTTRKGGALQ